MQYKYIDGTGNTYQVRDNHLKYLPMTAELSSSGTYDGRDPWSRELSKIDLMRIVDILERAIWSSSDQIVNREMGSGTISKTLGDERTVIYLRRTSESNNEVQDLMTSFKP